MLNRCTTVLLVCIAACGRAQTSNGTQINLQTQARNADFSNFGFTRPVTVGTTLPSTCQVGQLFFDTAAGAGSNLYACTATNVWTAQGRPGGVTSVTWGTLPNWLTGTVTNATTTPALSVTTATGRTSHQVLGTGAGGAFGPISLSAADLPALITSSSTGTAANVTGTVGLANGGTGQTTALGAFNALSPLNTLGDLLFGGTSGAGTRLGGNTTTTKKFLTQTGTGTTSAAPVWGTIASIDLPSTIASNTTGNAATATALASAPTPCASGQYATGITASGSASCAQVAYSQLSGNPVLSNQTVQVNGTNEPNAANLNFAAGSNVTLSGTTSGAVTTVTINSQSSGVTANQCSSNQYANSIANNGTLTCTQPNAGGIGGLAASATTDTTNAGNISSGTLSAGRLPTSVVQNNQVNTYSNQSSPFTPTAGNISVWTDSTNKVLSAKNDAGTTSVTVVPNGGSSNQFVTGLLPTGALILAEPSFANITGTLASAQLPATISSNTNGNAATATALASAPASCASGQYATGITASGSANCAQVAYSQLSGNPVLNNQTVQVNGTNEPQAASLNFAAGPNVTLSGRTSGAVTTVTINSQSSGVTANQCASNQYANGIAIDGTLTCTQPNAGGIGGLAASATTDTTNAGNINSGTLSAGRLPTSVVQNNQVNTFSNQSPPSTPTAGNVSVWTDSTNKVLSAKNDAGATSVTVVPSAGSSNQFVTGLLPTGALILAQPSFANIAGTLASAQLPTTISSNTTGNAATATALASVPTPCASGRYATGINASGSANCAQVAYSQLSGNPVLNNQTVEVNGTNEPQAASLNFAAGPNVTLSGRTSGGVTTVTINSGGGVTGPGTSTSYALPYWTDTGGATLGNSSITTDLGGDLTTGGNVTATSYSSSGTGAGTLSLKQGSPGSFPANSASLYAPNSISNSYQWVLPATDSAGAIVSDGNGTPGHLSIATVMTQVSAPTSTGQSCSANTYALDSSHYLYICQGSAWYRTALTVY